MVMVLATAFATKRNGELTRFHALRSDLED
jgi:hypothetical protein